MVSFPLINTIHYFFKHKPVFLRTINFRFWNITINRGTHEISLTINLCGRIHSITINVYLFKFLWIKLWLMISNWYIKLFFLPLFWFFFCKNTISRYILYKMYRETLKIISFAAVYDNNWKRFFTCDTIFGHKYEQLMS